MKIDTTILFAILTFIALIIGFLIKLRTVKKLRLENIKLTLEIQNLRKIQEESERRIVTLSTDEVIKYNQTMFSRNRTGVNPGPDSEIRDDNTFLTGVIQLVFYFIVVLFICYLLFDIYRLVLWGWSLLLSAFSGHS